MRGSTAGLASSLKGRSQTHYALLSVLDTLFSSLVVAPAVVGYWRSTWKLTMLYLLPDDPVRSDVISLCIGILGHLVFGIGQHFLTSKFHPDKHRIMYYTVSRLYTACYAFTCVNSWRGAWELLDRYTEGETSTVVATTLVSVISLAAMRAIRNVSAAPFVIAMDSVNGYFEVPTMFKTMVRHVINTRPILSFGKLTTDGCVYIRRHELQRFDKWLKIYIPEMKIYSYKSN